MRLADLEPILEELAKEGRIRTSCGMVSLKSAPLYNQKDFL